MAKKIEARVLVDLPAYGVKADDIISAEAQVIKSLADVSEVDPHADAVAYAKANGAKVIEYPAVEVSADPAAKIGN